MSAQRLVTVVIVNFNSGSWLQRCLESLLGPTGPASAIKVLDNASCDGSSNLPGAGEAFEVVRSERNIGFAAGVNRLSGEVGTPYMLILNPDCEISFPQIEVLLQDLELHPEAAMNSGCIVDHQGHEQRGSRRMLVTPDRLLAEFVPWLQNAGRGVDLTSTQKPAERSEVEAVSGACMLIRHRVFRDLGGLDASFPMHFEDLDLMARLRTAGWRIRYCPDVVITHAGGVSSRHRPVRVAWNKHAGLWRYLRRHCLHSIPVIMRPVWWLAIWAHAILTLPVALLRSR